MIAHTYRFLGHHVGDPLTYRDKEEPALWRQLDPIPSYGRLLLEQGIASAEDLQAWDREAAAAVKGAVDFAEASPEPDASTVMEGLFA